MSDDIAAERQADRTSYKLVLVFTFLSWVTLSTSSQIDAIRADTNEPALLPWFTQLTSHIVVAGLALIVPALLNQFRLNAEA